MPGEHVEVGRICWSATLPFVRLFSTFGRAISIWPLTLGFLAVTVIYLAGRILDAIWLAAGAGVLVSPDATMPNEVHAFAAYDRNGYEQWVVQTRAAASDARVAADGIDRTALDAELSEFRNWIDQRLDAGLRQLDQDTSRSDADKSQTRRELRIAADVLRVVAGGKSAAVFGGQSPADAFGRLLAAGGQAGDAGVAREQARYGGLLNQLETLAAARAVEARGPFIALLEFEISCFASAIQGVCTGRIGFDSPGDVQRPAMVASIVHGARGVLWLARERLFLAVLVAAVVIVSLGYFGGAICRIAAVKSARDEALPLTSALAFSREKLSSLVAAPLLPLGIFVGVGLLMALASIFAAVPGLNVLTGLLYVLALLGGVALVFTLVGVVFGFPLMFPTIAVEGSDAFDAVQRSLGYVYQRAWSVGFYSMILAIYGGISFVVVRLLAMLLLKLTNSATGLGMSLFGALHSTYTQTLRPLDAMWHMPAWQDLPLLPSADGPAFWGEFAVAPLGATEAATAFLLALWVFLVVGLVGGFVVSLFHCGATEMYLLLRREVDAVDYDEIYYEGSTEEPAEAPPVTAPPASDPDAGAASPPAA
ncbi:MAG: hypothetical protein HRF50_03615 [Phycisphaerae bacterium]|jgi:hypothetical protein